jgi:hypothetical protein
VLKLWAGPTVAHPAIPASATTFNTILSIFATL